MKLLPAELPEPSDPDDGLWEARPGWPRYEGSWVHPPLPGQGLPEFEFEEGHDHNKNKAPPVLVVGSGCDAQVRQPDGRVPGRLCRLLKLRRDWYLEGLAGDHPVHCGGRTLGAGDRVRLRNNDTFSLLPPPTSLTYRVLILDEDNWYIDIKSERDYPNKHRSVHPYRQSACPECPDELKRLAWQTDQMRRRSEEDSVRVADWAAFSQYVKRHFYKHGIECVPWVGANRPLDPRPPPIEPRPYPPWIADIVSKERMLPGISPGRALPFASSLRLSGRQAAPQPPLRTPPPPAPEGPLSGSGEAAAQGSCAAPGGKGGAATGKARGKGKAEVYEAQRAARMEEVQQWSFKAWLETLDESGYLIQYHDDIAENFDTIRQIIELYFRDGEIQKEFFEDVGIKKVGHRRIFEKWFADMFGPG